MEILNEKKIEMVDMECKFSDSDVLKFRQYYKENVSEEDKAKNEIKVAVVDILTKAIKKDFEKTCDEVSKETADKIELVETAHKKAAKSKLRFGDKVKLSGMPIK